MERTKLEGFFDLAEVWLAAAAQHESLHKLQSACPDRETARAMIEAGQHERAAAAQVAEMADALANDLTEADIDARPAYEIAIWARRDFGAWLFAAGDRFRDKWPGLRAELQATAAQARLAEEAAARALVEEHESETEPASTVETASKPKGKRTQQVDKGDAPLFLSLFLQEHHDFEDLGTGPFHCKVANCEPISLEDLAEGARVSPARASTFMKEHFEGMIPYRRRCRDAKTLARLLHEMTRLERPGGGADALDFQADPKAIDCNRPDED